MYWRTFIYIIVLKTNIPRTHHNIRIVTTTGISCFNDVPLAKCNMMEIKNTKCFDEHNFQFYLQIAHTIFSLHSQQIHSFLIDQPANKRN